MALSITELDLATPSSHGFEFEYIPEATGEPSGVFITVVGTHSEQVKCWLRKSINQARMLEAVNVKKGKEVARTIEDDERFAIESAAIRIVGWRNISDEFNFKNACLLCEVNPDIRAQVIKESDNLGNFLPSKKKP